jgi:hypothetical protein
MKNLSLMLVVMCTMALTCHCLVDVTSVAISIGQMVFNLHSWSDGTEIPFLGSKCTAGIKGRIRKLKWVWDGRFSCDGRFSGITGNEN